MHIVNWCTAAKIACEYLQIHHSHIHSSINSSKNSIATKFLDFQQEIALSLTAKDTIPTVLS